MLASHHLALLRTITSGAPGFAVWKNAEAGLEGSGDIDAVAPASQWPFVIAEHRRWVESNGFGPPLQCRHVPGLLVLVAFAPGESGKLLQLDVYTHIFVQGAPLVAAEDLVTHLRMDARGFRVLRPGAEGFFKLLQSSTRSGKPQLAEGARASLAELLRGDPVGVQRAAPLTGRACRAADRAADAAAVGSWDRRAMAEVTGWCLLAALRRPLLPIRRVASGLGPARGCPLLAALANGRRVPLGRETWMARVAASHALGIAG